MDQEDLRALLHEVARGLLEPEAAARKIGAASADLSFARPDRHRGVRCGFPEVVFCPGKSPEQAARLAAHLVEHGGRVLLTRAGPEHAAKIAEVIPDAVFDPVSRTVRVERERRPPVGLVAVVSAGTADLPVAEEAAVTAEALGARVERVVDVGIAGLHRLAPRVELLREALAIVVVAGMEGALPSVVGGLTDRPVVAVPTSVGYGASFGGLTALLSMLNSCVAGVTVVNIDNGFGGGYAAALINRLAVDGGGR
jgi:hypothetical protein